MDRYTRNKYNISIGNPSTSEATCFSIDVPPNVGIMDVREALKDTYLSMKNRGDTDIAPSVLVKRTCEEKSWTLGRFPFDFVALDVSELENAGRDQLLHEGNEDHFLQEKEEMER